MWTVTVALDLDKQDVGTATATWNAGQADEFVFTARGGSDQIAEFVEAAQRHRTEAEARKSVEAAFVAQIEGVLNAH